MKLDINPRYYSKELYDMVKSLPFVFDSEGEIIFKGRNTIKKFYLKNDEKKEYPIIIKRFKRFNFIQKIVYSFFKKSKAERAYLNGIRLADKGINTPASLAFLETQRYGFREYGYFLSEIDLSQPICEEFDRNDFNKNLAKDFALFVSQLHEKGILHNDLNSTNVLFKEDENGNYSFSLIDINRMNFVRHPKMLKKEKCFDNLTRFTGRMDLYEYVLINYIKFRQWNLNSNLKKAINIKKVHDRRWKRKKKILHLFR